MSEIKDFVSRTSLFIAGMRAIETERYDRLFEDPFAADLAGDEVMTRLEPWKQIREKGNSAVVIRIRFFDDFLLSISSKFQQVVMLGAGMDTRAFRLPWASDTNFYELDRVEILEKKESILKDIPAKCNRYAIAADFEKNWSDRLLAKGYRTDLPSVWLLEGLLYYLRETEVHDLLQKISDLSTTRSWIGADLINAKMLQEPHSWAKYWLFGCDSPEQLFARYGWKASVVQPGDEGVHYNRFKKRRPPREVPDVARNFFITAEKITEDKN
jgi:methyltransferase (TIGR00027 family)